MRFHKNEAFVLISVKYFSINADFFEFFKFEREKYFNKKKFFSKFEKLIKYFYIFIIILKIFLLTK